MTYWPYTYPLGTPSPPPNEEALTTSAQQAAAVQMMLQGYGAQANTPRRGTLTPALGVSFDEPDAGAPPTAAEVEAKAIYDEIERPKTFPIPKRNDEET